jgi:hypothetical protein
MGRRWVSAVALYGPKTGEVRDLLESVQATLARQLGAAFLPYGLEQIHGTLIGLNAVREPATGALLSQYYLEHRGTRCVVDFEGVLQILEERFSRPLAIRIGGIGPGDDLGFTSQGMHLHERTFSARNGALVLMGWPVSTLTSDGAQRPLDDLRRNMNDANVLHRYHATATDVDNDFYLVLGHYADAAESMLAEAERTVRRDLERHPVDVRVGRGQVRIVASDSPTLAPARFAGQLPLAADDLVRLYNA